MLFNILSVVDVNLIMVKWLTKTSEHWVQQNVTVTVAHLVASWII